MSQEHTEQQKAEAYVRTQIPELMELSFGCVLEVQNYVVTVTLLEDRRTWTWIPENGEPLSDFFGLAGSKVFFDEKHIKKIIGHPIQLQHWLRVLGLVKGFSCSYSYGGNRFLVMFDDGAIYFNTDGQPSTEADYKAFNDIVCN